MRQIKIVFFLLAVSLIGIAQEAAPAPAQASPKALQQQIADLKKLNADQQVQIKALEAAMRQEMRDEAAADQQTKSSVRKQSFMQGAGLGAGIMLLVAGAMLLAKKQPQSNATTKAQARAASA